MRLLRSVRPSGVAGRRRPCVRRPPATASCAAACGPARLLARVAVGLLAGAGLASIGCGDLQQGYYGPCDEPAGLGVGCPVGSDVDDPIETSWDACLKLARCGVILTGDDDADMDGIGPFEECVREVEDALGDDPNDALLVCIEASSCPELARAAPESVGDAVDPRPNTDRVENLVGWCGRLDP